jgi:hypothetical protein
MTTSTANVIGRMFLFPGDIACNAMGLERNDKGELVRMLVNSLIWIVIGMTVAVIVA